MKIMTHNSEEQQETNLVHSTNPVPGDYWEEHLVGICPVVMVTEDTVFYLKDKKNVGSTHWTWDTTKVSNKSRSEFKTWLRYDSDKMSHLCWADCHPKHPDWETFLNDIKWDAVIKSTTAVVEESKPEAPIPFGSIAFYRNNHNQFYPNGESPYLDNALDCVVVYRDPVTVDTKLKARNDGFTAGLDEGFKRGVKSFFDALSYRAANNYHGRAETNKVCDAENKLIMEWATDAMEDLDEDSYSEWVSIIELQRQIRELNSKLKGK